MTAVDVAVLGDRSPTLIALVDRNCAKCRTQIEALKRFKLGVADGVRVFVFYLHEFDWLFQAWEIHDLPTMLMFGTDGVESRAKADGPLTPEELVETFARLVAVDLSSATFYEDPEAGGTFWERQVRRLKRMALSSE